MLTIHVQVKEYIKRAKAWRNKEWADGDGGMPKSYLLSLLVVKAYEMCRENSNPRQDLDPRRYIIIYK